MEISKQKHKVLIEAYQELAPYFGHEEFRSHLKNSGIKISDKNLTLVFDKLWDFMDSIQADTNPYLELWDNESDPNAW